MNVSYFYMTTQGEETARKLCQALPGEIYGKTDYKERVRAVWDEADAIVFIMATGIAVRTIAPLLRSKTSDPAVIVMDQNGRFVISLLSGHLGGANRLAAQLAKICGGMPVITTGTDAAGVPAMDLFAQKNRLRIENIGMLKYISSAMIEGQPLAVGTVRPIEGRFPDNVTVMPVHEAAQFEGPAVIIGKTAPAHIEEETYPRLYLTIRDLVVGVGCKKDMPFENLMEAFRQFTDSAGIPLKRIGAVATFEMKKDEPCIRALAKTLEVPLIIFTKEDIDTIDMDHAGGKKIQVSQFVRQTTGVGSVSEACAYLGAGCGHIMIGKTKYSGITFALAKDERSLKL